MKGPHVTVLPLGEHVVPSASYPVPGLSYSAYVMGSVPVPATPLVLADTVSEFPKTRELADGVAAPGAPRGELRPVGSTGESTTMPRLSCTT
jgi:hypothetical protein